MNILIPTLGRIEKQTTWDNLTPKLRKDAVLVVAEEEAKEHKARGRNVLVCPAQGQGIAKVRQWIMGYAYSKGVPYIAMVDDDLRFQVRRPDFKIVDSLPGQVEEAFFWLRLNLRSVTHCALSPRSLGYANPAEYVDASRGIQCVAYDVKKVVELGARFDKAELQFMSDFHMTLQLLKAGYPNRVSLNWRYTCGPTNAPGGCSLFRTPERQTAAAYKLAALHGGLVKVRRKQWKGVALHDVTVYWKKALKYATK